MTLLAVPLSAQPQAPPAPVRVAEAVSREMAARTWVPGSVASRNDARVAAEVAGRLIAVAEVGDVVAAGEAVARIDDAALTLEARRAEAAIKRLEANLAYLEQEVARLDRLTAEQIVAASEVEQMRAQRDTARQELAAAEAERDAVRYRLSRSRVTAPFTGKVVERLQQPGGFVSVGTEIVRLVDVGDVEIRASAPLAVEPYLREEMKVPIRDRERFSEATVRTVVRVGDERSRMFELRLAPEGESWMVGAAVRVGLPASEAREVVAVPRDALVLRADSTYVFRVNGEGAAERLRVETGIGSGELVEVVGDVAPGDKIIIRGAERLRPGQRVAIQP